MYPAGTVSGRPLSELAHDFEPFKNALRDAGGIPLLLQLLTLPFVPLALLFTPLLFTGNANPRTAAGASPDDAPLLAGARKLVRAKLAVRLDAGPGRGLRTPSHGGEAASHGASRNST